MADPSSKPALKFDKKYKFDPITSDDTVVSADLGGNPVQALMVSDVIMVLNDHEGIVPDIREQVPNIRNMEMDEEDVIICAFPKSGTHWIWEIASMLRSGKAEYHEKTKITAMFEFVPPVDLRAHPEPRVYNAHYTFNHLPKEASEKKCKIIFIQRNPKDVLVSFLPFMKGLLIIDESVKWEEFFDKYMEFDLDSSLFNWFYYTKSWLDVLKENGDNIHCLTFEDLKEDPVREITKLASFLEVEENLELFIDIAEKCSFKNLKKASLSKQELTDDNVDRQFMFRKGEVGDWKNYFTVAQNERFDEVYSKKMKGYDVTYRYSL